MSQADLLHYVARYGVVVCRLCHACVAANGDRSVRNHFGRGDHPPRRLKGADLALVEICIKELELSRPNDVVHPTLEDQPVPAIPYLDVLDGFHCVACGELTTNEAHARYHVSKCT